MCMEGDVQHYQCLSANMHTHGYGWFPWFYDIKTGNSLALSSQNHKIAFIFLIPFDIYIYIYDIKIGIVNCLVRYALFKHVYVLYCMLRNASSWTIYTKYIRLKPNKCV